MDIPVQRAETFYLPPASMPADAWALVPPAERVLRWFEVRMQRRVTVPDGTLLGVQVWARIDAGRWVADCPCGSAQVVTPTDPRFACPECGTGWIVVIFPKDADTAEAAVTEELPPERFWWNDDDPRAWNRPASNAPEDAGFPDLPGRPGRPGRPADPGEVRESSVDNAAAAAAGKGKEDRQ